MSLKSVCCIVRVLHLQILHFYQLKPGTFQVFNSHMWLVAAVLDDAILEASNFYNLMSLIRGLRI